MVKVDNNKKVVGRVIIDNVKGRTLVEANGVGYIIPAIGYHKDQEIFVDKETALMIPSVLLAIQTMFSDKSFEEIVKFIKETF